MTELYGKGFLVDTNEPNAKWLDKYIHPDDRVFVTGMINECIREKKAFELEHRVLQADGNIGWTYSRAVPLPDGSGGIKEWFGVASDITERKQIENEKILLESYHRNYKILESITDSFYALNQELCFIYVNKGAEKEWGIPRSALIDRKISEVFPDMIDESLARFNRVIREQTSEHYELYSKVTQRWIEMHVYPASNGISVYFRDIQQRKQMEEALRESQTALSSERELLKVTLESLGEAVLAVDREARIIFINETAINLTGYTLDEAIGETMGKVFYVFDDKTSEPIDLTEPPASSRPIRY
jgi:PAS domain S-box-containing protein